MSARTKLLLVFVAGALIGGLITLVIPSSGGPHAPSVPDRAAKIETVQPRTLLAWTPLRLPPGFTAAVKKIEGVRAVAEVRSGIVWLDSWNDDQGQTHRAPTGFRIPMEVAAIDPSGYRPFVPSSVASTFEELARGGIVMGTGGAKIRHVQAGAVLHLATSALDVSGVVDDGLIGAHEGAVSLRTAEKLGVVRPRYLLVALRDGASIREVEHSIEAVVPSGVRIRIRAPGETPEFRQGDAVLPPVRLKELFGEFAATPTSAGNLEVDPQWLRRNITSARVPVLGIVTCHRVILGQLRAAFEEIDRRGLGGLIDPSDFGGCFFPRYLSQDEDAGISHHSWGIAFDVNVSQNPFGREPHMDKRIIDVFERWGFTWGGRWLVPDSMHFEFLRFPLSPKG